MKKKGFTLVELLAVIAILAILVIIALPNVLGMFNTAKKNTFVTELQSIYSTAETQFVSDSMDNMTEYTDGIKYARVGGTIVKYSGYKKLDLSGTETIDFYIHFNLAGKVTEFFATDGQFQYIYSGAGLAKEDIKGLDIDSGDTVATLDRNLTYEPTLGTAASGEVDTGVITVADATSYLNTSYNQFKLEIDETNKIVKITKQNTAATK